MRKFAHCLHEGLLIMLLLTGCGGSSGGSGATTAAAITAASWEGTWSGRVDWVSVTSSSSNPSAGDTVTISIGTPVSTACETCKSPLTVSSFTGTDAGPELGSVALQGQIDLYAADLSGSVVNPTITGKPYSNSLQPGEIWTLSGNTITITGIGTNAQDQSVSLLMGTLTRQ